MGLKERTKALLGPSAVSLLKALANVNRKDTYSQFGEDAFLHAYFWGKEWKPGARSGRRLKRRGFYVDVGAYSPTECSNTYVFYQCGWRGINVDATPESVRGFQLVRRRDINLNCAIAREEGEVLFYVWDRPSVFNTMSEEVATRKENELGEPPEIIRVPCLRLETVLKRHLPVGTAIDFLSVDVEGMDLQVLQSNDWERYRPELVVVEDHVASFDDLSNSPVRAFMRDHDYDLHAWIRPSVIYRNVG
jgi:FkbM family methyltransferase